MEILINAFAALGLLSAMSCCYLMFKAAHAKFTRTIEFGTELVKMVTGMTDDQFTEFEGKIKELREGYKKHEENCTDCSH